MARKKDWSYLKDKYPEASLDDDPTHAEAVTLLMAKLDEDPQPVGRLIEQYEDLVQRKAKLEAQVQDVQLNMTALERVLVRDMQAQMLSGLRASTGKSFSIEIAPSVKQANPAAVNAWLKKNGMDEIRTVNSQRLASLVKNVLEEAQLEGREPDPAEIPDGIDVTVRTVLRRR